MEGAILNAFHSLLISETFTLIPLHFLVPVLQIYMYFVLLMCQNAGILLDNRRGMDLRANNNFRNSDGKTENDLLCLVDGWGLGLSL